MSNDCNLSILGGEPLVVWEKTLKITEYAKKLGATKVKLLKYITSNDVEPSSFCVGYGSLKIF